MCILAVVQTQEMIWNVKFLNFEVCRRYCFCDLHIFPNHLSQGVICYILNIALLDPNTCQFDRYSEFWPNFVDLSHKILVYLVLMVFSLTYQLFKMFIIDFFR